MSGKVGDLQMSHITETKCKAFNQLGRVTLLPDRKVSIIWKEIIFLGHNNKSWKILSNLHLHSANTFFSSLSSHSSQKCRNPFLGAGERRKEWERKRRAGNSLCGSRSVTSTYPAVWLPDSHCYRTAETQVRWCTWSVTYMQVDKLYAKYVHVLEMV